MHRPEPTASLPGVVVAVVTYRRPHLLEKLLPRLLDELDTLDVPAWLLIVDNDPGESARPVVTSSGLAASYVVEGRPGIAAARNRALEEAMARSASAVVFIDDDEMPGDGWLGSLVTAWTEWGDAGVAGPVISELGPEASAWVRHCAAFRRRRQPSGTLLEGAATNNLLLDLSELDRLDLRFDDRYGLTGGSDTLLTRTLTKRGGRLRWCDEATVVEQVPPERATRRWVLRRNVRTGNVWSRVRIELADGTRDRWVVRGSLLIRGSTRIVRGAFQALAGVLLRDLTLRTVGECDVATGLGVVRGVRGRHVTEYVRAPGPGGDLGPA